MQTTQNFQSFFQRITETEGFGGHIRRSIPGYHSMVDGVGKMMAALGVKTVLDIGGSEGQKAKTWTEQGLQVVNVDPCPAMIRNSLHDNNVLEALGTSWVEDDGTRIPNLADELGGQVVELANIDANEIVERWKANEDGIEDICGPNQYDLDYMDEHQLLYMAEDINCIGQLQ